MSRELLVPTGAVNDLLGIRKPEPQIIPVGLSKVKQVNLRKLTVTNPTNPAYGDWVDRHAVLAWLEHHNEAAGGVKVVEKMIRQYRKLMEL